MENGVLKDTFCQKTVLTLLKLLALSISLFIYKYVYNFRINQEMILKLFIIILIILWIIKILSVEEMAWKRNELNLPIYLFIIILTLSLLITNTIKVSFGDYIIFISYIFLYFMVIGVISQKKEFNSFIKIFFITSFLVSIYALLQYYGLDPYFSELGQITSTIGQKNWVSNYLAIIFPVIFSYFLLQEERKSKLIYYLLLSVLYTTLLICQSRGIWISISLTLIFAIYMVIKFKLFEIFEKNKKWMMALFIIFLIITIIYSTDNPLNKSRLTVTERALSTFDEQDPSVNARLLIWKTTFKMIKDKPLFGSGIGTFKLNYLNYQADFLRNNPEYIKYSGKAAEAHNEYLQMAAELGIVGLGTFLSILFVFYSLALKYLKSKHDHQDKIIIFGLLLGITSFLIHSLFTFPYHVPVLGSIFFIFLGLTVVYIDGFDLKEINRKNIIRIKINANQMIKNIIIVVMLLLVVFLIGPLVVKPYFAETHFFKGMKGYERQNYNDALKDFKYAVWLDPYNGRILHALGSTYYHLDIQDEAQKILHGTKYYFNDRNIYRNLGLSYTQSGNYQEAEKEFKYAIYLDPKFYKAYNDLASLYIYQNEYEKAIEQWEKAIGLNLDFEEKYIFLYYIGIAYQKKQMPDETLKYFLQALQLVPEGDSIEKEIEKEINKIYKSRLEN